MMIKFIVPNLNWLYTEVCYYQRLRDQQIYNCIHLQKSEFVIILIDPHMHSP